MRSYTNKQGEMVTVTREHLETAVELKKQLQNAVSSRRCSWPQLVKLMESEGFDDADNSESYRCMIKNFQKSIGELPSIETYADLVSTSKLESIKSLVGDISYEKRDNQNILRELNKAKRDLTDGALIAEQIGLAFQNITINPPTPPPLTYKKSNSKVIACLADLHIGALVNTDINQYNYLIAEKALTNYAKEIFSECKLVGSSEVMVINLGDVIEHAYMRYSQAIDVEFTLSEQLEKATELIISFLFLLVKYGLKVSYAGIAGNHDRYSDKDRSIFGDHVVRQINHGIKLATNHTEHITFIETDDYSHSFTFNGRNIKAIHGDLDPKADSVLSTHSSLDGIEYDVILLGHWHHHRIVEVGLDKYMMFSGSLKGADNYGQKIRRISSRSQLIVTIHEDGEIVGRKVSL